MINGLKPAQRISLSDNIVEQLTGLIAREELKPGERIPSEKQLCEQFGVGRTSVREALKSLSVMGILESHAGDGTFVSPNRDRYLERAFKWGLLLDRKVVNDLVETRLLLESHTTYLAARRATADDLAAMERAVQGMEESVSDPKRYLQHDLQFHLRIALATQNTILGNLLSTIRGYLQSGVEQTLATSPPEQPTFRATLSITQHKKILRALKKRRANDARRAMREHILSSQADVESHVAAKLRT
jgi:GntR family transcriptional repressor for pyruvate dehydrogenase complex